MNLLKKLAGIKESIRSTLKTKLKRKTHLERLKARTEKNNKTPEKPSFDDIADYLEAFTDYRTLLKKIKKSKAYRVSYYFDNSHSAKWAEKKIAKKYKGIKTAVESCFLEIKWSDPDTVELNRIDPAELETDDPIDPINF